MDIYNKILKEALDIMDFDSWDDSEQTFKENITNSLNDPNETVEWFDKNYYIELKEGLNGKYFEGSLEEISWNWEKCTALLKNLYSKSFYLQNSSFTEDDFKIWLVKYIIAITIQEHGFNIDKIKDFLNDSKIGLTNWKTVTQFKTVSTIMASYDYHARANKANPYLYILTIFKRDKERTTLGRIVRKQR